MRVFFSVQEVHNGQKTNPLSIRTRVRKKVPAVALAAPGHSRLGDEDGFSCQ